MKCSVSKEVLSAHLQKVCNIVSRRPVLPILNNVRLEAGDNTLILKTTDPEITIRTELRADVEYSGVTTLPAKSLLALISKLPGSRVEIDCGDRHHAKIKSGSAEFVLKGLDPVDFPDDPLFEKEWEIRLTQSDLGRMIDSVSYATSPDCSRKVLHGISFSVKDNILTVAATDGKRLAFVEKEVEENGCGNIILPLKTAQELRRLLSEEGSAVMEISERHILIRLSDTLICSKLIEGVFPNFRQIIPAGFSKELDVPRNSIMQTLDLLAAYRRFKHVRFSEAGEISGPWQPHGLEASQAVETDLPDARQIHTVLLSAGNEAEGQDYGHEAYSLLHGRKGIKSRANISFSGERKVFSKNLQ